MTTPPPPASVPLTRAARRRLCESPDHDGDLDQITPRRRKRSRADAPSSVSAPPPPPMLPLRRLPAALQSELYFEWLNEPHDLARLEVAAAAAVAASPSRRRRRRTLLFADCVGSGSGGGGGGAHELRARRVLAADELAWLRARGVRVRLLAEVRVGTCFFGPHCHHCRWGEPYVGTMHYRREWLLNGELHRDNDLPAVEEPAFGAPPVFLPPDADPATAPAPPLVCLEWYRHGVLHRDGDLPAQQWFHYDRIGGGDGQVDWAHPVLHAQIYYQHGLKHRDGDKPASERLDVNSAPPRRVVWRTWFRRGKMHRGGDRPAVESSDGDRREWWWNGQRHRGGDRPAVVRSTGLREWWRSGNMRRGPGADGGPTTITSNGSRLWQRACGILHRDGDLPAKVLPDGSCWWYRHGMLHRDGDRPAIEEVNCLRWYRYGTLHRAGDRAAVIERRPRRIIRCPRLQVHLGYWRNGAPRECARQRSFWRARELTLAPAMLDEANARCAALAAAMADAAAAHQQEVAAAAAAAGEVEVG